VAGQANGDQFTQVVDGLAQKFDEYAAGIAGRLGQPLSGTQLSQDDAVARWNYTPLGSTDAADAQYHALVGQGVPPGQALDQTYPMRSMLFANAQNVNDAIATAKQVQQWAADATGQKVPEPFQGSTLPVALDQQRIASMQAQPQAQPLPTLPASPPPPVS
jgi:hypothetical protein